jgi:hypothetical protein
MPSSPSWQGARMERLGYENVSIYEGDGTRGYAEKGPFDAIIVSASGSHVPDTLLQQLEIGGRLVMPVGEPQEVQTLLKITRASEDEFEQEELGAVRFVPLIGAHAWNEKGGRSDPRSLPELIRDSAEPLPDLDDPAFGALFDRFADARVVLLGEASHGTSEFYRARAAITQRLIEEHGFTIVAVEADWPDAAVIDRYVRNRPERAGEEAAFQRFPTWMWRNTDVQAFIRWLRSRNAVIEPERMAGFYGLDLYNLGGSIRAVIDYLDDVDPKPPSVARGALRLPPALCEEPARLWPDGAHRGLCAVRAAGRADAPRAAPEAGRICRRGWRRISRRRRQCPARQECRGLLPGDVSRRGGELESARHAHVRDALPAARGQGAGGEGGRLGA